MLRPSVGGASHGIKRPGYVQSFIKAVEDRFIVDMLKFFYYLLLIIFPASYKVLFELVEYLLREDIWKSVIIQKLIIFRINRKIPVYFVPMYQLESFHR
jgi:hypothetical protein